MDEFISLDPTPKADDASAKTEGAAAGSSEEQAVGEYPTPWMEWRRHCHGYWSMPKDGYLALHNEMLIYTDFMAETAEEIAAVDQCFEDVRRLVKDVLNCDAVELFGSRTTDLQLPGSDLDVCVNYKDITVRDMRRLADVVNARGLASVMEVIDKARVPLVKFQHKESGLSVDISFNTVSGQRTADMVKEYMDTFPELRPMVLVLKRWLQQRDLNETYRGGVGSFMLVLMIVRVLQDLHKLGCATGMTERRKDVQVEFKSKRVQDSKMLARLNLGAALLYFFRYYGIELNYNVVGLSVRKGGKLLSKVKSGWMMYNRPYLLAVENPDDISADVGKNSCNIRNFRVACQASYFRLRRAIEEHESDRSAKRLVSSDGSLLASVLPVDDFARQRVIDRKLDRSLVHPNRELPVEDVSTSEEEEEEVGGTAGDESGEQKKEEGEEQPSKRQRIEQVKGMLQQHNLSKPRLIQDILTRKERDINKLVKESEEQLKAMNQHYWGM